MTPHDIKRRLRRVLSRARRQPHREAALAVLAFRGLRYRLMSDHPNVFVDARTSGGVLAIGSGAIQVAGATLGCWPSPGALDSYIHLEARSAGSVIEIGHGSVINNGCTFIAEGPGIRIGRETLVGPRTTIFDSDFHHLDAARRSESPPKMAPVLIGNGVFIGAQVMILKGVTIDDHAVVAGGAVVTRDVGVGEIAAGNPAKIIGTAP